MTLPRCHHLGKDTDNIPVCGEENWSMVTTGWKNVDCPNCLKAKPIHILHGQLLFKWFDLWIGGYIDQEGHALYICLLPMAVIKLWRTEHIRCSECGKPMQKIAIDTGDGWALQWSCEDGCNCEGPEIEWPFGDRWMSPKDLRRAGFEVV